MDLFFKHTHCVAYRYCIMMLASVVTLHIYRVLKLFYYLTSSVPLIGPAVVVKLAYGGSMILVVRNICIVVFACTTCYKVSPLLDADSEPAVLTSVVSKHDGGLNVS